MNYRNPELKSRLAAEYVLGTLRGHARLRFERLMREDELLRDEVADWQTRMMPLADSLVPIKPRGRVWQDIRSSLGFDTVSRRSLLFWRNLGVFSSAAAILMAAYISTAPIHTSAPGYIAVIADKHANPVWLFSSSDTAITIKSLVPSTVIAGRSLELWLLPEGGQPVSLGLLPLTGNITRLLPHAVAKLMANSHALAVSLEPAGGSPTGQPTGPILYQAPIAVNT
ncbi:MAG TPA: anti-sigma factor [Burkholderiales bacterium]|nr:anti-sigma factor [Burkholderiales bacterium]